MSSEMVLGEAMRELSSTVAGWGPAVANHLWQSTVFGVAAGALTLALRRNRAAARYWLWLAASLKFAAPFALLMAVGERMTAPRVVAPAASQVYFAMEPVELPFVARSVFIPEVVTYAHAGLSWREVLPVALLVVWACGVGFVLVRWCVRWIALRRIVRAAVVASDGREVEALRRLEANAGLRQRVELRLSESSMGPGIVGVWRPVLLWPAGISERLTAEHIEAIVAHELTHVRRRDNLTAALHMAVEAAFWFHPLVWWAGRQMMEERERACDEAAVELGAEPRAYAESILRVCEFCLEAPLACVSGISAAGLKERLKEIMSGRARVRLSWAQRVGLVCAACVAVAAPVLSGQGRAMARMAQKAMPEAVLARLMPVVKAAGGPMPLEMADPLAMQIESVDAKSTADDAIGPAFEVASIRPTPEKSDRRWMGTSVTPSGRIDASQETLESLVWFAYVGRPDKGKVTGGPDWVRNDKFDIEAKIDESQMDGWDKLSDVERSARVRPMVRKLLMDRFHLKVRTEMQVTPVYALVQAKSGAKMQKADAPPRNGPPLQEWLKTSADKPNSVPVGGFMIEGDKWHANAVQMTGILGQVNYESHVDAMVVDETGLDGYYSFTMKIDRSKDAPLFQDQLEQQLGLKLVPKKVPMKTYVIESAERPTVDGAEVQAQAAGMRLVSLPQGEPAEKKPRAFEVVSIRPEQPDPNKIHAYGIPITPDGISVRHVSLDTLIKVAYFPVDFRRWTPHMLQSEPEWAFEQYDIEAKVSDADRAEWQKQGSWNEDNKMLREMLRTMLAERFKLVVHSVSDTIDGWYIEVGKNGLKLTEMKPDEKLPKGIPVIEGGVEVLTSGPSDHPHIELYGVSMAGLAGQLSFLSMAAGQPVEDHTGLTGKYNLALYCLDPHKGYCVTDTEDTNPLSQWDVQALGLKLVPHKTQTNSIYIDHVEKPTEN